MNTLSPTPSMPAAGLCSIQRIVGRCLDLYCCEGGAGMGYTITVTDRLTGERGSFELRSLRDAVKRLGAVVKYLS